MILSNVDIKKYLKAGRIKIQPAPSEEQIGATSVDLTLADEFWKFRKGGIIDLETAKQEDVLEKFSARAVELKPGQMMLGKTVEKITLAPDVCGKLEGRSRYARFGTAIHVSSSLIHAGSSNHQILEIVNFSPRPVLLKAGMRVCQVMFQKISSPTSKPYAKFGKIARRQ